MNIYVGNLPFSADEAEIRDTFAAYGQVASVSIIKDKFTGQSRGFAFVEMPNGNEAQAAIAGLNGQEFKGRPLTVNEARPRTEGGGSRSSGGGSRGGQSDRGGGSRNSYNDRGSRGGGGRSNKGGGDDRW